MRVYSCRYLRVNEVNELNFNILRKKDGIKVTESHKKQKIFKHFMFDLLNY